MILIGERYVSADHIQDIVVKQRNEHTSSVIIVLIGHKVELGDLPHVLDEEMALEVRRRLVKAIVDYKAAEVPTTQQVELPTYQEVHPNDALKPSTGE